MIQGQVFRMAAQEFMEVINIPRHTGQIDKIHSLPDMTDGEFATLLDTEGTEDFMPREHLTEALGLHIKNLVLYSVEDFAAAV